MYGGGPGFGGRPGGLGGGGPLQEPNWLGTAFFAAIILSFIPGPWQIILGPIISLINLFYMFKFGIFLLFIAGVFGIGWWFDMTTLEGQCVRCGTIQRGPKGEPFQCVACGEDLEAKDGAFVRYVKSGKAPGSAFDQLKDFAKEAGSKVRGASSAASVETVERVAGRDASVAKKNVDVIDAEVL